MRRRREPAEPLIARPDPRAPEALYLQVTHAIEDALRAGRLGIGERLPPERDLAETLGVSRTTVTGAYQELHARGLLRGHVGRGTVVVALPADARPEIRAAAIPWSQRVAPLAVEAARLCYSAPPRPDVIAFDSGWPDASLYPTAVLDQLLRELPDAGPALYAPAPASGDPMLREGLAGWLGRGGIRGLTGDDVLITSGGQQGLNVVARALLGPGDVVLAQAPTYSGAILAFRWAGADVVGLPGDEQEGLRPEALEEALARYRPKLLYLIPTFHNPTGLVLGRDRRRQVLELAARHRVPILESDLYSEIFFEETPPPSLRALDAGGIVIHQGSFSKLAVPGLRIGWLVAPPGAMTALTAAKALMDLSTAPLGQRVAARFLGGEHAERHLATVRAEVRRRRDHLVAGLRRHCPALRFRVPSGGYYIWAELPAPVAAGTLAAAAKEHGVAVRPGTQFMPETGGETHVRLCFAGLEPARLTEGTRRLGAALDDALARAGARTTREVAVPVSVV